MICPCCGADTLFNTTDPQTVDRLQTAADWIRRSHTHADQWAVTFWRPNGARFETRDALRTESRITFAGAVNLAARLQDEAPDAICTVAPYGR